MDIQRRSVLRISVSFAASTALTNGFAMRKNNARTLGRKFNHLRDPELRAKEAGDTLLEIRGVELSGAAFENVLWRKIRFIDCDFIGAYEIKADMETVVFEDCRFAGIFNFGTLTNVDFLRCRAKASAVVVGGVGSKGVRFLDCTFIGTESDPNRWGGMGSYGETEFVRCKMRWTNVVSETRHTIIDCEFSDVDCGVSEDGGGSEMLIERSKLIGKFDMRPATLLSLTIRDTVLENLDLSNATVKGDVLMERVKGGYINAYVKEAKSLIVRNSQIYGKGKKTFEAYAGGIHLIEIDSVIFGGDVSTEPVTIAGGTGADLNNVRARVNDSIIIRKSKVPHLRTRHIHTSLYQLQDCELDSLDLSNSRIAKMAISGNTISRSVDFTNTRVKESKVQALAKGQAKLDGSNVKAH
ncbi:hypothetical protein [Acidovorax cavernicola]|nr:hypothetical protein [Acidovorax cavernicola]